MLIVMHRDSYVQPHRHFGKSETLTVIEGTADNILFDSKGNVSDVIRMTPASEGGAFFYRMPEGVFHTLFFRSEWLAFLETTIGPFDRANTEVGSWSPPESEPDKGRAYLASLVPVIR